MSESVTVGELARELSERHGREVRPRDITDLFYKRLLKDGRGPIVGGRRLIPKDYIPEIEQILRDRGLLPGVA